MRVSKAPFFSCQRRTKVAGRSVAVRGGHSPRPTGRPHGPRRCGGPEHIHGVFGLLEAAFGAAPPLEEYSSAISGAFPLHGTELVKTGASRIAQISGSACHHAVAAG